MLPTGPERVGRVASGGVPAWLDLEFPGAAGVQAGPRAQSWGPVAASLRPSGAGFERESHLGRLPGGKICPFL